MAAFRSWKRIPAVVYRCVRGLQCLEQVWRSRWNILSLSLSGTRAAAL